MITLICTNKDCGYSYQVSEKELEDNYNVHKTCLLCKSLLEVEKESLKDLVKKDVEQRIKEYIDKWLSELGGDETLSLVQRNRHQSCYRLYVEELRKRGFIIKDLDGEKT